MTRRSYAVDVMTLAPRLLGATLVRLTDEGERLAGRIVETEAYGGAEDTASHAHKGRRTARNEPMYAAGGTSYVYFTYGMHHCMNVSSGKPGDAQAVLLRALEPTEGLEVMHAHRGARKDGRPKPDTDLCSGPAKLCQALGLDRSMTGLDLTTHPRLWIEPRLRAPIEADIVTAVRVGIGSAGAWVSAPMRWYLGSSPHVSVR